MFDDRLNLPVNFLINGNNGKIILTKEVGRGGNCIIYDAVQTDSIGVVHKVRVKECYPAYFLLRREESGKLNVGLSDIENFAKAKKRFLNAYEKNAQIKNTLGLSNSTVNTIEVIEQNNTYYAVMSFDEGNDYKNYHDENLKELLEHVKSLAVIIGKYHQNNYLHLDIKPENILVIPETSEHILLFDFDSIITINELIDNANLILSYSDGFAAPEQVRGKINQIGFHTDIYSIGAILFYKLFNRKANLDDGKISSQYDFTKMNYQNRLYQPKLYKELEKFFHKTITLSTFARWKNINCVLEALDKLIKLADVECVFAFDNFQYNSANFIGRNAELETIDKVLQNNQLIFVSGIGGIGKTEIAKKYAAIHRQNYDTIIFCKYSDSIMDLVINEISVNAIEQEEGESPKSFFDRKISVLCKILTPKDLIIVDNLDCDDDESLENLLECPCKFIITTRMDFSDYNFNQIEVGKIEDSNEITALFTTYNDNYYNEIEFLAVQKIIQLIENHTMTVELTAKYLRENDESPEILLKRFLEVEGTTNIEDVKIKQRKDTKLRSVSVTEHLRILFNLSNFTNNEIEVMRSLSLLGGIRINQKYFMEMLKLSDSTAIESLKKRGWIESDNEKISLHKIILDLVYTDLKPSTENCPQITAGIIDKLKKKIFVNWTTERVDNRLTEIFMQRVTGNDLQYADLCVNYGEEEYLASVEKICSAANEIFAYDILQRFYRLKIKFTAQIDFFEEGDLVEICKRKLIEIKNFFESATNFCKIYSTDSNYLAKNYLELAFNTENAINSELIYIADGECSTELNQLYEKIIPIIDEAGENILIADTYSSEEKIELLEKICKFYSASDYTSMYRSENFFDPEKQYFFQTKIDELHDKKNCLYPLDVRFDKLAFDCEIRGEFDKAINFYKKSYEIGESAYDSALYSLVQVYKKVGNIQEAVKTLEEILNLDRKNPNMPFSNSACLDLINIFITEKNLDTAKELAYEMAKRNSKNNSAYSITGSILAYFKLYIIEKNSSFWQNAIKYYRLLGGEKKLSSNLNEFLKAYVCKLSDSEQDLIEIQNIINRIENCNHEESIHELFKHAIKLSENHAEYHIKFLITYSAYLNEDFESSSVALEYCEKAQNYFDENNLNDEYLQNIIYRAQIQIMRQSNEYDYKQVNEILKKCDYFLLTLRESENLSCSKKFKLWREAAYQYGKVKNYSQKLRCLQQAEKINTNVFDDYWQLEMDILQCFFELKKFNHTKIYAQKLYCQMIEKYSSIEEKESFRITDKIDELISIFDKIECRKEVFILSLFEIYIVGAQVDENFMGVLSISESAEVKILKVMKFLPEKKLTAEQIDFVMEKIDCITRCHLENLFGAKCLEFFKDFVKKYEFNEIEFKNV